jgi:hypothetical protein
VYLPRAIGRNGHRLLAGRASFGPVTGDRRRSGCAGPGRLSGKGRGLCFCEELVHDFGAGGDDGSEFAAVDEFGGAGGGVSDEAGDFLDADAAVAHQADEGGPELARRPVIADAGFGADAFEHFADVARVQCDAVAGGEDQPDVLPLLPGGEPLTALAVRPGVQCLDRRRGEGESAP